MKLQQLLRVTNVGNLFKLRTKVDVNNECFFDENAADTKITAERMLLIIFEELEQLVRLFIFSDDKNRKIHQKLPIERKQWK